MLTQWKIAKYIVEKRKAHYHFTVKGNQKNLLEDITYHFCDLKRDPDYITVDGIDHGRIETRKIWLTADLNEYLNFPYVGQVFMIERITIYKKFERNLLQRSIS